jgi:hypothetical protein
VKKQTVSDIRKAKAKFKILVLLCDADAPNKPRKHMKIARESSLKDAVLKWNGQQRSCGVHVRRL